jgi:hypothetical protein
VGVLAPPLQNQPAEHKPVAKGEEEPWQYAPGVHEMHADTFVAPVVFPKVPAGQGAGCEDPGPHQPPAGQRPPMASGVVPKGSPGAAGALELLPAKQ